MLKKQDWSKVVRGVLLALFFLSVGALLFSRAMAKSLNHDEHQFVVSGRLLAERGLLPYRDYPYHHQPMLVFLYGFLFRFTTFGLMGARVVSVLSETLTMVLLFHLVYRSFQTYRRGYATLAGLVSVVIYLTNPIVYSTSGLAWNHDFAAFLTVAAVVVYPTGFRVSRLRERVFLSGLLVGLAIGTRLTYAPLALPFFATLFTLAELKTWRSRIRMALWLLSGMGVALAPSFFLFLLSPSGYVYGNYVYPQLNTVYRQLLQHRFGMTLGSKLLYFGREVLWVSQMWLLFLGFLVVTYKTFLKWRTETRLPLIPLNSSQVNSIDSRASDPGTLARRVRVEGLFFVVTAFCLLASAFVPTPPFSQYFFAPIPLFVLCLFFGIAAYAPPRRSQLWLLLLLSISMVLYIGRIGEDFDHLQNLRNPELWGPMEIHRLGKGVAERVSSGPILTLAPIIPLEGDLDIYPAFATGPFTWRTASLLGEGRQRFYGVVSPQTLEQYLETNPPTAVLTGFEGDTDGFKVGDLGGLEGPLRAYAKRNGFTIVPLGTDRSGQAITLWVRSNE